MNIITKEELIQLTEKYSYDYIKKTLHIKDDNLNKLLEYHGIKRLPLHLRKPHPIVTSIQKEFILGSLLGDSSVTRKNLNYRMAINHGWKQEEYIKHKKEILGDLSQSNIIKTFSKGHNHKIWIKGQFVDKFIKDYHGFILSSKVHPYFTELREKLYPNDKKTISKWWLDQITERSLAYWVMDDGGANHSDNSYTMQISTYCYTYDEHLLLKDFLKSKFDIDINLQTVKNRGYGYTIRLNTENSKKLRDLIKPFIIPSMMYKVDRNAWLIYSLNKSGISVI
jgi:hypothetical protein